MTYMKDCASASKSTHCHEWRHRDAHPLVRDDFLVEDSFVCIAKTPRPVFFGQADDGQGTDLFFLICGLESFQHLQTLSRVSLLCSRTSLPEDLRAAETPAEMYAALQNAENALLALAQR